MELRRSVAGFFHTGPPDGWTLATTAGLASLVLLWAWQLYATWGVWGNLTVDSGHEMYVPALLAEGKTLYRDTWFAYSPAAPYFNSYLFRVFGVHLNVLYWAGSISVLVAAMFLYLIGMRLSASLVGWAAGAAQIAESFHASLFCFPLPYSFAAVYGCVVGTIFLWAVVMASQSSRVAWMLAAGSLAGVELLIKPEFGAAAYMTVGLLLTMRSLRQPVRLIGRDLLALLPGLALCGAVVYWMVSLAGVQFITQENMMSWPTSYFMRQYGQMWLKVTGFTLSVTAFRGAAIRTLFLAGLLIEGHALCVWKRLGLRGRVLSIGVIPAALALYVVSLRIGLTDLLLTIMLPADMVLYVAIAALVSWWNFWRQPSDERDPAVPLVLSYAGLLAWRILMQMSQRGYPIYYNGPAILGYLLLARNLVPAALPWWRRAYLREIFVCALPAIVIFQAVTHFIPAGYLAPLTTRRGTVRVTKDMAENYQAAIAFMKAKAAAGESVLSVPEDTSLYFLAETPAPTRVYLFTPGSVAPGNMTDETISQIEHRRVRYLLWSNRTYPEYGVPVFGTDFNQELGEYFRTRYRRIGPITRAPGWQADVWERRPEMAFQ